MLNLILSVLKSNFNAFINMNKALLPKHKCKRDIKPKSIFNNLQYATEKNFLKIYLKVNLIEVEEHHTVFSRRSV